MFEFSESAPRAKLEILAGLIRPHAVLWRPLR